MGLVSYKGVMVSEFEKNRIQDGMENPAVRKLSPGTKIFRVEQKKQKESGQSVELAAGTWWFGQKAFNKMMKYCVQDDKADRGLGYASREAMAILFGWSDCDLLIEGYIGQNTEIFYGKGKPQGDKQGKFEGWKDVEQWFIPQVTDYVDLGGGKSQTKLSEAGKKKIQIYRQCPLRSVMGNDHSYKS